MASQIPNLTLGDCSCEGEHECFHCDQKLPDWTPVYLEGDVVIAHCPECGGLTPMPLVETN
jgi:hypothetical protein